MSAAGELSTQQPSVTPMTGAVTPTPADTDTDVTKDTTTTKWTSTAPEATKEGTTTKGVTGSARQVTSFMSVTSITNTDIVSLDEKQLKLIFEITRYTLLSMIAMLSTFMLGFGLCYLYFRQNQYPYDGCNLNCLIKTNAAQSFLQAFDCFINVIAIHLNTGFQRKNYELLCKYPHKWVEIIFLKRTKKQIVTKTTKKLNETIELQNQNSKSKNKENDTDNEKSPTYGSKTGSVKSPTKSADWEFD